MGDIVRIVVHHVGLPPMGRGVEYFAQETASYCINGRDFPGGAYQIVLAVDGEWALCNSLTTISYHVGKLNPTSVGICMEGDYRTEPVPAVMVDSLEEIVRWVMHEKRTWAEDTGNAYYPVPDICGHCEAPGQATACPGVFGLAAVKEVRRRVYWT